MIKELLGIFVAAVTFVVVASIVLIGAAWLGYGFGHFIMWGAGGILDGVFGIASEQIPTVTAWLFVLAAAIGSRVKSSAE